MVTTQQQRSGIHALGRAMERLGYSGELLQHDYGFGDWFSPGTPSLSADLAAFGQTPPSYATACLGVVASNGLAGVELVRGFRSLGAPVVFEVGQTEIVPWRVSVHPTAADRLHPIGFADVDTAFKENECFWAPEAILRAKNIQPVGQRQLDFVDLGLLPALEDHIREKLDPVLKKALAKAVAEYRRGTDRTINEQELFQAAFWLLAGKVFHDREHGDFVELSLASSPDDVLSHVGRHYGETISPKLLNKMARKVLHQIIWGSVDFRNLSVEVLAEVWANTLVTPELRAKLGIHSTPRALAKYMVDRIPFQDIPEDERYVLEPCCGSARFLIATLQRLRMLLPAAMDPQVRHHYFTKMLVGYEMDPFGIEISRLGLMLADYPNPDSWQLRQKDVFLSRSFESSLRQARVVLCNPPFQDLDDQSRRLYCAATPRQPAALLLRVLRFLHPRGVLGFVLPRKFLDGRSYKRVRELLVERFREIEVLSLPDKAFTFADAETAILIASRPTGRGSTANVVHRKVDDKDWGRFESRHNVSREDSGILSSVEARGSISIPDLHGLWASLQDSTKLGQFATIRRGIEWRVPISRASEQGKRNRKRLIRETGRSGYQLGVEPSTTFCSYCRPRTKFLSMRKQDQRGNAYLSPWHRPKVILNAVRRSRGRWRMVAYADREGLILYQTHVAVWPKDPDDVDVLSAILNSLVANAYVAAHEHGRHVTNATLSSIPLPTLDSDGKRQVGARIQEYRDTVNAGAWERASVTLLEIDTLVTAAYRLSHEHERLLLSYFRGSKRPLPEVLAGREYSPARLGEGVTFDELFAITKGWEITNTRRCELIEKRLRSRVTEAESEELEHLQTLADKRLQLLAPLPTGELDEVLESIHG